MLVVLAAVTPMIWIGFRSGGTEVGDGLLGLRGIGRYWTVLTPIVLAVTVPLLGRAWRRRRQQVNWMLAPAGPATTSRDTLWNFVAGYLAYAALVLVCSCYLLVRVDAAATPLVAVAVVTVVGPLMGGYTTLALGYVLGELTGQEAIRIVVVVVLAILDAVNYVPSALSASGTGRTVEEAGGWEPALDNGPITTVAWPTADSVGTRAALVIVTSLGLAFCGWLRYRRLSGPSSDRRRG
ncbi:hypothetical protein ABTZ99_07995 [Actinosynnema sp. NPDC002837]